MMMTGISLKSHILKQSKYFHTGDRRVTIYHGDALSLLKEIPDASIDMVFSDPPYFGNQSGNVMKRTDGHNSFTTDKASWAGSKSLRYQFDFHCQWIGES
jgi:site-specific DNA-methyltransferase (adenine-specific)